MGNCTWGTSGWMSVESAQEFNIKMFMASRYIKTLVVPSTGIFIIHALLNERLIVVDSGSGTIVDSEAGAAGCSRETTQNKVK